MSNIPVRTTKRPLAQRVAKILGATIGFALIALTLSLIVWAIVSIWQAIL